MAIILGYFRSVPLWIPPKMALLPGVIARHRFACRILCRLLEFCSFSATCCQRWAWWREVCIWVYRYLVGGLEETLRKLNFQLHSMYGVPRTCALLFHTGTLALPWPIANLDLIDKWVLQHIPQGVRRTAGPLDRLPLASKHPHFDDILVSSM